MERRTFFLALSVALLLVLGLNFALGWAGRNAVPRLIVRQIKASHDLTHVFLGNSVVQAGFSPEAFDRTLAQSGLSARSLNAGLGWTTSAEHAVLWEEVRAAGNRPKVVFYGFFDHLLHEEYNGDPWWSLAGNMAMGYYVNPGLAARYHAPDSRIGQVFMRSVAHVPLFTERSTIWGKVEQVRRILAARGMRAEPSARADEAAPQDAFRALESSDASAFAQHCDEIVQRQAPFRPAIRELIASAQRGGARVYVVEIPMPPAHRRTFYAQAAWQNYKRYIKARFASEGVSVIEAGDWVPEADGFADSLHLNRTGAQQFSEHLGSFASAPGFFLSALP